MKRYRFLLLAFFLATNVHAVGFISGMTPAMNGAPKFASVNSTPDLSNSARAKDIRRTSPRNTAEIGSTVEPVVSGLRTIDAQNDGRPVQTIGTTKTSSKGMSCKTYEGKTYDQGEAGFNDCIRNIRTDRQGTRTVP